MNEPAPASPERGGIEPPAGTFADHETIRQRVAYRMYATAERAAMVLPESAGRRLFSAAAAAAFHLAPRTRAVVERNLSRVLGVDPDAPLVRAAAREAFGSYARYWYETFRVRVISDEEFLSRLRVEGVHHLERVLAEGRGAVLALPHLGNWDAAGKWAHLSGWNITAVAELLRPRRLFEMFLRHREALGMGIVPLYDSTSVGQELVRRMGENHLIALVADRDLKGRGVEVQMFGAPRRLPAGPALLALSTGTPLLPASVYDIEDGWLVMIHPPLELDRTDDMRHDVTELTRKLAVVFERSIAAVPTQWHMFQPGWEQDRPAGAAGDPAERALP